MASTLVRDHRGIPRGERLFVNFFLYILIVMFFIIYFVLCIVDAVGVFCTLNAV